MLKSNMVGQIDRYMTNRALFSADILAKALKWSTNYSHPLAVGYRSAKQRLENCVTQATARSEARRVAYEQLKARTDFALGVLFALMGPFTAAAMDNLKTSMKVSNLQVDDRVLTKWYDAKRSPTLDFDQLLKREQIRQTVLNQVIELGTTTVAGQVSSRMSPAAGATGGGPQRPTGAPAATTGIAAAPGFSIPEGLLSGEFTPAEFEQNVQNIFNGFAVNMHDRYLQIFDGPAEQKRQFLINATKSVLACPPPSPITDIIPPAILESQLFGMIAGNYILSFQPSGGRIWPSIGVDLAFTINKALQATGHSIITNNPRPGKQTFEGSRDEQMAWDGTVVMPVVHPTKIREIGKGAATVLEAYMQAIAMMNAET
jgi:hypothetical protein